MVADILIYHPTVAHYLRFVATTVGRDKILRTLQYFARFYAWYLLRTNGSPSEMAPWNAMKAQFGLARKILRVGKNVEHVKAAAQAADAASASTAAAAGAAAGSNGKKATMDSSALLRYAAVGRQLGYAGYLSFDAATVFDAAGIRKWNRAKDVQKQAYRFWAMGLLCSVLSQALVLYHLRQREAKIDRKDGEGVVESKRITKERAASRLQLISDIADFTIPVSSLGWVILDDGIVGLAGTLSSLIGVYNQWKKTT